VLDNKRKKQSKIMSTLKKITVKDKIVIIIIAIFEITISIILLDSIIHVLKYLTGDPRDIAYIINNKDQINYRVYLKKNNFLNQPYLDSSFSYITDLVDYIKTNFSYKYDMNNAVSISYRYKIVANIIARYADESSKVSNPVWQTEFYLLPTKINNFTSLPININEQLNIDIGYYNNL
jgi:hypothetical protein